jgi:hypothetical protein
MDVYLWNIPNRKYCEVDHWKGADNPYQHSFGGPVRHRGTTMPEVGREVHLLYNFDLTDPKLGLKIPHLRWLPIYYPFRNNDGGFSYRVVSDDEIVPLTKPWTKADGKRKDFFQDFPAPFRKRYIHLRERAYDSRDPIDVSLFAPMFGLDPGLTAAQKRKLYKALEQECYWLRDEDGRCRYDTLETLVPHVGSVLSPLSFPEPCCPNPACDYHKEFGKLNFFFLLCPGEFDTYRHEKVIFKEIAGADSGQLRGLICPRCHTVDISNAST